MLTSELSQMDVLSTNLYQLKSLKAMDEKCTHLLEILRKSGWGKTSLCFLNSKFETRKTLYVGYVPEMIKFSEEHKLPPLKRKELLSSTTDRWRIAPFYYLPWRDERARYIVSDGLSTEIPLKYKIEWHKNDLLYGPIYYDARAVAVLTMDEPKDHAVPNKVNLRVPTIIHSIINEIIQQYLAEEQYANFRTIYRSIVGRGTIGIIELDITGKIIDVNAAAEQILTISKTKLLGNIYHKVLNDSFIARIAPPIQEAIETLVPVELDADYADFNQNIHKIKMQIAPLHILYDYTGMIWSLSYSEKSEIFSTYQTVLKILKAINDNFSGDYLDIQNQMIKLMCTEFQFKYPRLYVLSEDQITLKCVHSYDPELEDFSFFDHPYNRNSLASNAILENEIVYSTLKERNVRDLRRIWERLKTKAAIAIPLHIMPNVKAVLVCDIETSEFFLDESKRITLSYFGNLISITLRPVFDKFTTG